MDTKILKEVIGSNLSSDTKITLFNLLTNGGTKTAAPAEKKTRRKSSRGYFSRARALRRGGTLAADVAKQLNDERYRNKLGGPITAQNIYTMTSLRRRKKTKPATPRPVGA